MQAPQILQCFWTCGCSSILNLRRTNHTKTIQKVIKQTQNNNVKLKQSLKSHYFPTTIPKTILALNHYSLKLKIQLPTNLHPFHLRTSQHFSMSIHTRHLGKVKFASIKGDPGILHVDQTLGKKRKSQASKVFFNWDDRPSGYNCCRYYRSILNMIQLGVCETLRNIYHPKISIINRQILRWWLGCPNHLPNA